MESGQPQTLSVRGTRWWVILSVIAIFYVGKLVVVPLLLAIFFAILLWPLAKSPPMGLSRYIWTLLVVIGLVAFLSSVTWILVQSLSDVAWSLPEYAEKFQLTFRRLNSWLMDFRLRTESLLSFAGEKQHVQQVQIVEKMPALPAFMVGQLNSILTWLSPLLLVPLLIYYLLCDKENLLENTNAVLSRVAYLPKVYSELPRMLRAFCVGNFVAAAFLVLAHSLSLWALGFNNWLSLGILSGLFNLLPVIGLPLSLALPLLQSVAQDQGLSLVLLLVALFSVLHFVANNVILPLVIGVRLNINAAALLIGLLFWSWLWGAAGFFLAIPMTALTKIFFDSHPDTLAIGNLMAAKIKGNAGFGNPPPTA